MKSQILVAEVKNALHFLMWLSLAHKLLLMQRSGGMFLQQQTKFPHFFRTVCLCVPDYPNNRTRLIPPDGINRLVLVLQGQCAYSWTEVRIRRLKTNCTVATAVRVRVFKPGMLSNSQLASGNSWDLPTGSMTSWFYLVIEETFSR
jgi:hypothetical protein